MVWCSESSDVKSSGSGKWYNMATTSMYSEVHDTKAGLDKVNAGRGKGGDLGTGGSPAIADEL